MVILMEKYNFTILIEKDDDVSPEEYENLIKRIKDLHGGLFVSNK